MKKFLLITLIALLVAGCVPYPLYDDGYYHPDYGYYGPYPYGYAGPEVNVFVAGGHHHGFRGGGRGHGFHGGGHGSRGGGGSGFHGDTHWGGGRR